MLEPITGNRERKNKKRMRKKHKKILIVLIGSTFFFVDRDDVCSKHPQDCWHLSLHHGRYVLDWIKKSNLWHIHHELVNVLRLWNLDSLLLNQGDEHLHRQMHVVLDKTGGGLLVL